VPSPIEQTEIYDHACSIADSVWREVSHWGMFEKQSLGQQLTRAIDSIAANLVEGDGCSSDRDAVRFFVFSRRSAREARHWIRRGQHRSLMSDSVAEESVEALTTLARKINGLINYRNGKPTIREPSPIYNSKEEDPFSPTSPSLNPPFEPLNAEP